MSKRLIILDEAVTTLLVGGYPPDKTAEHITKEFRKALKSASTSFVHKNERVFGYKLKTEQS